MSSHPSLSGRELEETASGLRASVPSPSLNGTPSQHEELNGNNLIHAVQLFSQGIQKEDAESLPRPQPGGQACL